MDLVQLTEEIVKSLVVDQDAVSVKEFPTEEENVILIQVIVAESDIGRVIGKGGRCAPRAARRDGARGRRHPFRTDLHQSGCYDRRIPASG